MHLISHTCYLKLSIRGSENIVYINVKNELLIELAKTRLAAPVLAQIGSLPLFYMLFPLLHSIFTGYLTENPMQISCILTSWINPGQP